MNFITTSVMKKERTHVMLRIFRYIKDKWYVLLLIITLLFLQTYCDLALPNYTSKLIDIGIQQKGIEDGVPDEIQSESLQKLFLFMNDDDIETVQSAYQESDDVYILKNISKTERESLNHILGIPMVLVLSLSGEGEEVRELKQQVGLAADGDILAMLGQLPKEQRQQILAERSAQFEEMPKALVTQMAITYTQREYQALGENLDDRQTNYLMYAGLKMLGMALLTGICSIVVSFIACRLAARLGQRLRNNVYRKVLSFSGKELNQFSTASLITRSTNDIQQVQMTFTLFFRLVLYAPILGIGGIYMAFKTEPSMTWIIVLAVGILLSIVIILLKVAMPKFKRLQVLIDKLNLVIREILTGTSIIRAFSAEQHEETRFEAANGELTKTQLFVNRVMTMMMPLMLLIMNGISILIIYSGAHAVDAGSMQIGNVMAFIQYAMQIIMAFLMITMLSVLLPRATVSANRIMEVMDTEVSILDVKQPVNGKKAVRSEAVQGVVEFEHVFFWYPEAKEPVLSDISFTVNGGETVAIIGSTGSGKSSLINLIPRLFDVTEGIIKIDGVDVRDMELSVLRDKLGYVPQKGVLFSGTIDTNIRYGCEEASAKEVQRAAEIAQAWEFINEKAEGLQSPIAQGGENVSGGQKQRLSIARAIAKQPEIYIFDDSFSALDYKTDVVLRRTLQQETQNATKIIVAQRISTILHADNIIVLDEGRIVGQGTHKELLKNCEVYKQIATSQLSEEELGHE